MKYLLSLLLFFTVAAAAENLTLQPGDHIAFVGNGTADRMQHDGWLETLIYQQFPQHDLVIRHLGFAGDEVATRARSENFGTPDEWLQRTGANVIFAFFGYNESFDGPAGVEKFKQELDKYLKATVKQKFSDRGAPRLVLFSPLAQEKHTDPNLPDPAARNQDLKLYTEAMREVARANNVSFVDLYAASEGLYKQSKEPLTFDGVHLTAEGNKALAPILFQAIFGVAPPGWTPASEGLRQAILDRNDMWHSRYRTVDGYNVFGGRSALAYLPGKGGFISDRTPPEPRVSNYKVMQQEMAVRDVMTANRDRKVWATAQGREFKVDDADLPPIDKIETNIPGDQPDGLHTFLSGEAAIAQMKVPVNCKVNLFASEEMFPELIKPVQMNWDTKGRLWVAAWRTYPERTPTDTVGDSILILEDTNGDGKADKCTHFIDDLNCPTGFQFYKDGILLMQAPDLWFVRDTDGDGKADTKERVLMGLDSADSHHTTNAMALDGGGAVYLSDGVFHRTQVETINGPVRNIDAAIYRYEPRTQKFETYISYGFANPHGKVFDYWGNDYVTDATGNANYFAPAFSGSIDFPQKHPAMKTFWKNPSRPCPGTGMLSSSHFPPEFQNNFLNCNVISLQTIFRAKLIDDGSGIRGESLEDLVTSKDTNFRPCAVNVGPDGAVYFSDWSNAIIGHMQHHLRDPNRDHVHGRIYRITYEGRPLLAPRKIAGEPIPALLELLKNPDDNVRQLAKIELGGRDSTQVVDAAQKWAVSLDAKDPAYPHHLLEALWVHQWHNVVDAGLLQKVLASPEPRARAAAARVLCYWRDRIPQALPLFEKLATDDSPRVRLEAVRAASFFRGEQVKPALAVVFAALGKETDYYLDYCATETLKQLSPKETVLPTEPKALAWFISRMSNEQLAKAPETEPVLYARLERKGIDLMTREDALGKLARLHQITRTDEAVGLLQSGVENVDEIVRLVLMSPPAELANHRRTLSELGLYAKQPAIRRAGWAVYLSAADADREMAWKLAGDEKVRVSLLESLGLLLDPNLRAGWQPTLAGLLADKATAPAVRNAALRALPLMGPQAASTNFTLLASFLADDAQRPAVVQALRQLPRESWSKEQARPMALALLEWAKRVPADRRTSGDFVETVQLGNELASLMPPGDGARVRKELRGLGVSVFVIRTVREGMRYDTTRLVIEPGKAFEIIVENTDAMPHNLVVVKPGKRAEVGTLAQTMPPTQLDKQGRSYVPKSDAILAATKLLEPGQKETLKLKAPDEPGTYEYVCTFPGHWPVMYGQLIVTKDVEQAQAEPAPVVAGAPHQHAP